MLTRLGWGGTNLDWEGYQRATTIIRQHELGSFRDRVIRGIAAAKHEVTYKWGQLNLQRV